MSRACWSFGPDRVARALVLFPSMQRQLDERGVVLSDATFLGEFHVERAKHEDPLFVRSLEKAAAQYVREIEGRTCMGCGAVSDRPYTAIVMQAGKNIGSMCSACFDPMRWEGDDA